MDVITNSISVFIQEWKSVLGILYFFFLCGGLAYLSLKLLLKDRYAISEYLSLSLAVGLIPLFGGIWLVWLFNLCFQVKISLITVLEVMFVIIGSFYIFQSLRSPRPIKSSAYIFSFS
jgi:hypothetical protein